MRKELFLLVALLFALAVSGAMAQTTARQDTTTTTTTTTTGPEHNIEGCIAKEQSDFFLIPQKGEPFRLQATADQDLTTDTGHRVMVSGKWLAGNSASQTANANPNANANQNTQRGSVAGQASSGTGNDLHSLANRELVVDNVKSISDTCPVNWNPLAKRQK